jgi:hypothetical protein
MSDISLDIAGTVLSSGMSWAVQSLGMCWDGTELGHDLGYPACGCDQGRRTRGQDDLASVLLRITIPYCLYNIDEKINTIYYRGKDARIYNINRIYNIKDVGDVIQAHMT